MNRAAIYARLSVADENSTSTERQRKDCRHHAKSLGLEVVDEFTDEGISGYEDVERPAFDEAIEALVRGALRSNDPRTSWDSSSRQGAVTDLKRS